MTYTSNINSAAIDQNFPVAGQDNDTQVFRDNFTYIAESLSAAKSEIVDIGSNTVRTDNEENDLFGSILKNAVTQNITNTIIPAESAIEVSTLPVEFQASSYQIFKLATDVTLSLSQFPDAGEAVGKVTLEIYSDEDLAADAARKVSISTSGTYTLKKSGFPSKVRSGTHIFEVSSMDNPVIIEIWRHSEENIYVKYLGLFS